MESLTSLLKATKLCDFIGQKHLIGKGTALLNLIQKKDWHYCDTLTWYNISKGRLQIDELLKVNGVIEVYNKDSGICFKIVI